MKNKRVKGMGIALSAALILGCAVPAAAAQQESSQGEMTAQVSVQPEGIIADDSQLQAEEQDLLSGKETMGEKESGAISSGNQATEEDFGGSVDNLAQTGADGALSQTQDVPEPSNSLTVPKVTQVPEETPAPTDVPEETPEPTEIPEEVPVPTATPTPEEEEIHLPQAEQGWAFGRESDDSDQVIWILYRDGQIQQIWSWEQTGAWLQYDVSDTQLTQPAVPADGWYEIGDRKFFLRAGIPQTGWQANENGNGWYYCTDQAGEDGMGRGAVEDPATMTGIRQINGSTYYLNADGTFRKNTSVDQDGTRYMLGPDGKVIRSYKPVAPQWTQNDKGWWYQYEDGSYPKNCWDRIDGRLYSFDADGYMRSGGWYLENGIWYYLEGSGAAAEGWLQLNGTWYYLQPGTGKMQTGWYQANGTWYYSDASGSMYGAGWHLIGNTWYYMNGSGAMQTGWQQIGGTWYYLRDSGAMATGWELVNGTWYYLSASGAMYGGGWHLIGNAWYYMDGSGAMQTGWIHLGNTWYYLTDSGAMATGWYQVGNTWYYMDGSGAMQTGWIHLGNTWYYLDGSGAMQTGWVQIGGSWYYLTGSGAMAVGWLQLGDDWYYLGSDGAMYADRWLGSYYLSADGTWDSEKTGDQLDTLLQQVIDQVTTQAMSQEGKLRECYDYVVKTFSYERKYNFSNAAGWQRQYALEMLTKGKGNCYNFAATFGCLAEKLGYSNVRTIAGMTGKAGGGWTPHSWVEIDMADTTYIFDPEMEHANGYDLWKKTYASSPLRYQKF